MDDLEQRVQVLVIHLQEGEPSHEFRNANQQSMSSRLSQLIGFGECQLHLGADNLTRFQF
jgi:hypothetical protein